MQTETNLLPCPFCGSDDISEGEALSQKDGKYYKQTGCNDCGALGPIKAANVNDIYDDGSASKAWNTRA